ncbi:MAG: ATP-binding protein, partial [Anaerolineales bacterium]|nr:ATP-binding protein [Anaerolineales bacterium]
MHNPFPHGNPVLPPHFHNRTRDLRRLASRITTGQSTAIVGESRTGKTSLLEYLRTRETRQKLYGDSAPCWYFSYLDWQTGQQLTQAQFWTQALEELHADIIAPNGDHSRIAQAYQLCQENHFGSFVLEKLIAQIQQAGYRLILLLDEFDALVQKDSQLNSAEFFGGLRSIATRSRGALVLVTASRQPLSALNKATQEFNRTGSPYFNFLDELVLEPFSDRAVAKLLGLGKERFTANDRRFLARVGGGHPYLLQVAAAALWEAYSDEKEAEKRHAITRSKLHKTASKVIEDTWRLWSPEMRKAFMAVALDHDEMYGLDRHVLDVPTLLEELPDLTPELDALESQGYIQQAPNTQSGWRVRPEAFVWWLNEELIRAVRNPGGFETWIQTQEWGSLLKKGQRDQLEKAGRGLREFFKEGIGGFLKGVG